MQYTPIGVLTIVALSLAGLALFNHYKEADRAYQASKQRYEQSKSIIEPNVAAHSEYTSAQTERQQWRAEKDLEAQREMARTSWWIMVWTGVGVFLLFLTLVEANRTTIAAMEAADASRTAAQTAQTSAERQLRSYLIVSEVTQETVTSGGLFASFFGINDYRLRVRVENVGKIPAYEIEVHGDVLIGNGKIDPVKSYAVENVGFLVQESNQNDEPCWVTLTFRDIHGLNKSDESEIDFPFFVHCTIYLVYDDDFTLSALDSRRRTVGAPFHGALEDGVLERVTRDRQMN